MFKLNKSTHMMILMTFTIVFVVVYMYYMIRDVKKIYIEVKKHGQDITALQKLSTEVQELKGLVAALSMQPPVPHDPVYIPQLVPAPPPVCQVPIPTDAESVATEDIKKLVEDDDAEEEVPVPEDVVEETPSEEQVKKMKFEELKDLCKKYNISTKGTKESLTAKILEYIK